MLTLLKICLLYTSIGHPGPIPAIYLTESPLCVYATIASAFTCSAVTHLSLIHISGNFGTSTYFLLTLEYLVTLLKLTSAKYALFSIP